MLSEKGLPESGLTHPPIHPSLRPSVHQCIHPSIYINQSISQSVDQPITKTGIGHQWLTYTEIMTTLWQKVLTEIQALELNLKTYYLLLDGLLFLIVENNKSEHGKSSWKPFISFSRQSNIRYDLGKNWCLNPDRLTWLPNERDKWCVGAIHLESSV